MTFTLPDNVTTYTVTAHSANKDLYVGVNTKDIVSKLDFFIQAIQPRNVKVTDDLILNATSIAEEKYEVEYEFTIKELNKTKASKAMTNSMATVNFGKLPFGTYTAIIKGKHDSNHDGIEYKFSVVESTQEVKDKKTVNINKDTEINPSKNPVVLEIYNNNMSKYLKYIDFIESSLTTRLDTQIAYNEVQNIKDKYYNTQSKENYINLTDYQGITGFKNLKNGKDDILLTALISKYAKEYYSSVNIYPNEETYKKANTFELYLLAAANNEPVLTDLLYLKAEKDIDNYNKLLVTLSLEFVGDYKNAKDLYSNIKLNETEEKEYKSIIALIETYINKENAIIKINELIEKSPADEYLRFAILSFFENNSEDIEKQDTVKIVSKNLNETITINAMQVQTYVINNEDLDTIKFETNNDDLMVSYYYQTLLENIKSKNISKDINIKLNGKLKKGNTVTLVVDFKEGTEGEVRIALPNSLRLSQTNKDYDYNRYYLVNNNIDYVTFFKTKKCKRMEIPLIITLDGEYKFENIVNAQDGIYHISNSIDLKISK